MGNEHMKRSWNPLEVKKMQSDCILQNAKMQYGTLSPYVFADIGTLDDDMLSKGKVWALLPYLQWRPINCYTILENKSVVHNELNMHGFWSSDFTYGCLH